jgi:hypothetical protein
MPVSLDDDQLAIVMAAAQPLEPTARHAFLIAVAAELAKDSPELGPGSIHRLVREMQPRYFDAPRLGDNRERAARWPRCPASGQHRMSKTEQTLGDRTGYITIQPALCPGRGHHRKLWRCENGTYRQVRFPQNAFRQACAPPRGRRCGVFLPVAQEEYPASVAAGESD